MTHADDLDRTLTAWFESDALLAAPAVGLERALGATSRRRPLPAWLARPGSHWVGEAPIRSESGLQLARVTMAWSTAVILLLLASLVGFAIVLGARLLHPSPPTGRLGHLAFELNGEVLVADWEGANGAAIGRGSYPAWSPDGKHLAFRASIPGSGDGVSITDDAGHEVASFPGSGWDLAWSPDSSSIATWVGQSIGVYGLDGARRALLTLPTGFGTYRDVDPTWSRDGALLISLRPDPGGDPRQIWELPMDGRAPRPLPAIDPWQVASPDGTRFATSYPGPFLNSASLVITDADGTELRVLPGAAIGKCSLQDDCGPQLGGVYEDPVWSPTGDRVAFTWSWSTAGTWYDDQGYPAQRPHELRVVDVANGTVTSLARDQEVAAIGFSPEGDRILFSTTAANGEGALWTVDADGSHAQRLMTGTTSGAWQRLPASH